MLTWVARKTKEVIWITISVLIIVAMASYDASDASMNTVSSAPVHNWAGSVGAWVADFFIQWVGYTTLIGAIFIGVWNILRVFGCPISHPRLKSTLLLVLAILSVFMLGVYDKGGVIGNYYLYRFIPIFPAWTYMILWIVWGMLAAYGLGIPLIQMLALIPKVKEKLAFLIKWEKKEPIEPAPKPIRSPRKKEPTSAVHKVAPAPVRRKIQSKFVLPSVALLDDPKAQAKDGLTKEMMENVARHLEGVLAQFGVKGHVMRTSPGPVVTLYEFEPAPGIKTSRVIGLAEDMARAMSVVSVRMAVIPGSSVIGIEMPNKNRATVFIKELIDLPAYQDHTGALPLILGKNIGGTPYFTDLAKMPHLLVAGTTGSGKSVGINTMILSLLYRFTPEEVRLIMVDPKMLELSVYNGIPHLLTPVVTEPGKAVVALKWAVREMEDRYRAMSALGVRNIEGYNKKLLDAAACGKSLMRQVQTGFNPETGQPVIEKQDMDLTPLPYIIVIVDEMADLMLVAGKDVEAAIQRLAQMARAAGIHLIMATQRPSVDVITGTIKANFPTRISFQVTSKIDSRTILGEQGAEQLLGRGDMLYMPAGQRPLRIHGPFVSDAEIERVVDHLKTQGEASYISAVTEDDGVDADEGAAFDRSSMGGESDLYEQAVAVVLRDEKPSISYVQRQLRIGYNRAADLIDRMEREGIISKASPTGKREILRGN